MNDELTGNTADDQKPLIRCKRMVAGCPKIYYTLPFMNKHITNNIVKKYEDLSGMSPNDRYKHIKDIRQDKEKPPKHTFFEEADDIEFEEWGEREFKTKIKIPVIVVYLDHDETATVKSGKAHVFVQKDNGGNINHLVDTVDLNIVNIKTLEKERAERAKQADSSSSSAATTEKIAQRDAWED